MSPDWTHEVVVIHEHPEWQKPLFEVLTRRGVNYGVFDLKSASFLDTDPPLAPLYFNQASPSAYVRGNTRAVPLALAFMRALETKGVRVLNGADVFAFELSKTARQETEWRELIAAVRLFFPGPLTYAANWYGDLEHVQFWDDLDFIGVDAYFPLSSSPQASRAELEKGARQIVDRFAATSRRWRKPILLTEVGFAAHRGAWVSPHEEHGEYSEEDQALAYEVLFDALGRRPWLAGTFVWKAYTTGSSSGQRADFGFMGRKAEGVVGRYYGGEEGRARR